MEQKIISIPMPESFRQAHIQANRTNPQPHRYHGGKNLNAKMPHDPKNWRRQAAIRSLSRSARVAGKLLLLVMAIMLVIFLLATVFRNDTEAVSVPESEIVENTGIITSKDMGFFDAVELGTSLVLHGTEEVELLSDDLVSLEDVPVLMEEIEEMPMEKAQPVILPVPDVPGTDFKTFMDYRAITDKTSGQYQLQQSAKTNEAGFRTYNGLPMIALGTYYVEKVSYTVRVHLDNGNTFSAVVGDIKDDAHTTETNQVMPNGNVVEFIVDGDSIPAICWKTGDMSYADEAYSGNVVGIEILEPPFL